jgi:hypothetical protein
VVPQKRQSVIATHVSHVLATHCVDAIRAHIDTSTTTTTKSIIVIVSKKTKKIWRKNDFFVRLLCVSNKHFARLVRL